MLNARSRFEALGSPQVTFGVESSTRRLPRPSERRDALTTNCQSPPRFCCRESSALVLMNNWGAKVSSQGCAWIALLSLELFYRSRGVFVVNLVPRLEGLSQTNAWGREIRGHNTHGWPLERDMVNVERGERFLLVRLDTGQKTPEQVEANHKWAHDFCLSDTLEIGKSSRLLF